MDFTKISISTTPLGAEVVCGALLGCGVLQHQIVLPMVDLMREADGEFDYAPDDVSDNGTYVVVYAQSGLATTQLVRSLLATLSHIPNHDGEFGSFAIHTNQAASEDWENIWKEHFVPFLLGRVWIVPAWLSDSFHEPGLRVVIEPGSAFGTGHHITTRMAAQLLQDYAKDAHVLDIGCGSGILSFVAAACGAKSCLACDADAVGALQNTRLNRDLNPYAKNVEAMQLDILNPMERAVLASHYNVVVANITVDVICRIFEFLSEMLALGGVFIASGIIDERKDEVAAAADAAGLACDAVLCEEGWAAFVFRLAA